MAKFDQSKYEEEQDLSFEKANPGRNVWQILTGLEVKPQEKDPSKSTYYIPIQLIEILEGTSEDFLMTKAMLFFGTDSEKRLLSMVAAAGLWDKFIKNFGDDEDAFHKAGGVLQQKFQDWFILKMPSTLIGLAHVLKKGKAKDGVTDVENYDWKKLFPPSAKGKGGNKSEKGKQQEFED
jgi:hypothetical protein